MAFTSSITKTVVFVGGKLEPGPAGMGPLRGTGFLTAVPSAEPEQSFKYVITAAHVVRPLVTKFIRLSRHDGSTHDLEIPSEDWAFHPTEDVAVGLFAPDPAEIDAQAIPTAHFVGRAEVQFDAGPGDEVFFAGLLGLVESMGDRRIPMIRTGSIGALHQDEIPVRLGDDTQFSVHGHLIDCRSFGGFSGSPCFVDYTSSLNTTPRLKLHSAMRSAHLLGLVSGHFDLAASVALPDQKGKLNVPVAAGIAVVVPADTILEVLESEEQKERRDKEDAARLGSLAEG